VAPEEGISAIKIAAEGIAAMKLGRIDSETTANIGEIQGGMATNIIPNLVVLKGEARSHSEEKLEAQTQHMTKCLEDAAAKYEVTVEGKTTKASVESHIERDYSSMDVPDSSHVVQLVIKAAARMGLDVKTMASGGGCDANVFNRILSDDRDGGRVHRYGKLLWKREAALESWALKIERNLADTRNVWTFVNNHFEGFAPETCQRLANRLGFELPLPSPGEIASADPGQLDFFAGETTS